MTSSQQLSLMGIFNQEAGKVAAKPANSENQKTVPLSIRVTTDEKAQLERMAGAQALSAFMRQRLFGEAAAAARPKRYQKKPTEPKIDHIEIARLLGTFGQSELARSMLALSLAVQMGELEVSAEVENKLERACTDIHEIKTALIVALNVKPQGARR